MTRAPASDVIVIGAGIAGIAVAYSLTQQDANRKVVLLDALAPMSFTTAQSGENYRNWWPHPLMTAFIDHSIDLLEQIVHVAGDGIAMSRRGYALATRRGDIDDMLQSLHTGYRDKGESLVREHRSFSSYEHALATFSDGVDVASGPDLVKNAFPAFDPDVRHVLHVRRAGDLDSYQLGQFMLQRIRAKGGTLERGEVTAIDKGNTFGVTLSDGRRLESAKLIVVAGPFVNQLLAHLGESVPVRNILQQKFAFEDSLDAVPADQPFTVDLDEQKLDWSNEERELLADDDQYSFLAGSMPGNVHRRADTGKGRHWVRMGWAYNDVETKPAWSPALDERYPEIVLRAATRLNPALKPYIERMPAARHHYGGYYTMTEENLPIIGPLATEGAFVVTALSGFGTMAACAAGDCCARWVGELQHMTYATPLSLARYDDEELMLGLTMSKDRGVL